MLRNISQRYISMARILLALNTLAVRGGMNQRGIICKTRSKIPSPAPDAAPFVLTD
jgi:hypothetical protein